VRRLPRNASERAVRPQDDYEFDTSVFELPTDPHGLAESGMKSVVDQLQPGSYGTACYSPNGCADIVRKIARRINARQFNLDYPEIPRFVQHAIWRYCAQSELNVCNGNNIDDRFRCENKGCPLFYR
jgi:hypothetical protein